MFVYDVDHLVGVCPTEALAFMLGVTNASVGHIPTRDHQAWLSRPGTGQSYA